MSDTYCNMELFVEYLLEHKTHQYVMEYINIQFM